MAADDEQPMPDDSLNIEEVPFDVPDPESTALYKLHASIVSDPPRGTSAQPEQDAPDYNTPTGYIIPPASLENLAKLTQFSGIRGTCISAIAHNTVGLGYATKPREGEGSQDDPTDRQKELVDTLDALAQRDTRLGAASFTDLAKAVKTDEEEVGQGYMEVSRNQLTGQIDGLFHAPGKRVRRKDDRTGWVLLDPWSNELGDATRFYNFGEKVKHNDDGTPTNELLDGKSWDTNELIQFKLYTSESRDYGLPRDSGISLEYLADLGAARANVGFFDASGVPPTVLFIQGDEKREGSTINVSVPARTAERIYATLNASSSRQNRVAIIPIPAGAVPKEVKLGDRGGETAGYISFRDDSRTRIAGVFHLQPLFVGVVDKGRYSAEVERAICKEQLFTPEQDRYETRLQNTVLRDLGFEDVRVEFNELAIEEDAARRDAADKMAVAGTITRREHRISHGYQPLPEAKESDTDLKWTDGAMYKSEQPGPGQVPFGWNDRIVVVTPTAPGSNPAGRTDQTIDHRGLQPGLAGRVGDDGAAAPGIQKGHGLDHVEPVVDDLRREVVDVNDAAVDRALARTRTLGASIADAFAARMTDREKAAANGDSR